MTVIMLTYNPRGPPFADGQNQKNRTVVALDYVGRVSQIKSEASETF